MSTPSMRVPRRQTSLDHALARSWEISLADISTAFLHAMIEEVVHVWPPADHMRLSWNDWVFADASLTVTFIVTSHDRCMFWHMWTISSLLETRNF